MKSLYTVDRFYSGATKLRDHFEKRFANPRAADGGRFVWDYWHVPNQYTSLRTPAYEFFPEAIYAPLHKALVKFGRERLGCHDISPPWMSCYVNDCSQSLHADVPHGPWAYVFSLTPWKGRKFTGGETMLLRNEILNYWGEGAGSLTGGFFESEQIFTKVPSLFNRLTVFDPRVPHGVVPVQGPHDVRDGRLVIHGWFVQPRPFIEGPLPLARLSQALKDFEGALHEILSMGLEASGVLSIRLHVAADGRVTKAILLTNSLRGPDQKDANTLAREAARFWQGAQFGKSRGPSKVTIPVVFER